MIIPIRLKTPKGKIEKISQARFCRIFNVRYAPRLIAPRELRAPSFLGPSASTYIQKIDDRVGYGLFAFEEISVGKMIGEYTGVLSSNWVDSPNNRAEFNPYLLKYPFDSLFAIDAQKAGNETRFINHSFKNANCERHYAREGDVLRVLFLAKKRIASHAQIFLDYGKSYWRGRTPVEIER